MEEKDEQVVEQTTQETTEQVDESKFESAGDDSVVKVDLSKPPKPEEKNEEPKEDTKVEEDSTDDSGVVAESKDAEPAQEQKEIQPEAEAQETTILEEITEDSTEEEVAEVEEQIEEAVAEAEATGKPLPENIQKLMDFMDETGGDLEDYVRLNQDYSKLDDMSLLREYYKQTKSHLDDDEISFLMEDSFSYDEEEDDERDIKRKKLALKEQVASAKAHLDGQKSKYYEEIKAGSKLTQEQQKAIDFFNRYNKESEQTKQVVKRNSDIFEKETNNLFNDKFKGFEYNVGEKTYRFNVKDVDGVKTQQSDISNFMSKFVNEKQALTDAKGYHKALYTAMNPDAIAQHFYEQGKADAIKESIKKSKNIDMSPRSTQNEINVGGIKARVIGDDSNSFKFKIRNKK